MTKKDFFNSPQAVGYLCKTQVVFSSQPTMNGGVPATHHKWWGTRLTIYGTRRPDQLVVANPRKLY